MSKIATVAAVTSAILAFSAAPSIANEAPATTYDALGTVSFDENRSDHDLFTAAVNHVFETKKRTRLSWLKAADKSATVFIPNDQAVFDFINEMTGKTPQSEQEALDMFLETWNVYEIEWIIRYHVIKGENLNTLYLVTKQNQEFQTLGRRYKVSTRALLGPCHIQLVDGDTDRPDAHTVTTDVYETGTQTSHIIDKVMFPRAFDKPEAKTK